MFTTNYFSKNKLIGSEKFSTSNEAENKCEESEHYNKADYFEIINSDTDDIIVDGEIADPDEIIDEMFDGEDSKEGFDWAPTE